MLKLASYDIVFQEVPGEVSLALNLSNCPNHCKGCHSPHLWEDIGVRLNRETLKELLTVYGSSITCVCFMGGDADVDELFELVSQLASSKEYDLKIAWYSGKQKLPSNIDLGNFDFIKIGPYSQVLGGLGVETTNQQFFQVEDGRLIDKTTAFI